MKITKKDMQQAITPFYAIHSIYSIYDLVRDYERSSMGYFFSKDTMRFFKSRLLSDVFPSKDAVYFVTSEQNNYNDPRLFTVRKYDLLNNNIDTVGEFQGYETRTQALSAALYHAYKGL